MSDIIIARGLKSRRNFSKVAPIGRGSVLKGKNIMLKDHYNNLNNYLLKLKNIQESLDEKDCSNCYKVLNSLIFIKENIQHSIDNLSKYSDDTKCETTKNTRYLTKKIVLERAEEVLSAYDSEIEKLENVIQCNNIGKTV